MLSSYIHCETQELAVMPNTCNELLPDVAPYIELFEQTASLRTTSEPAKVKRMFDLIALRSMYQERSKDYNNPIDWIIKDLICLCSFQNTAEIFTSQSKNLNAGIDKNIDTYIKKAETEYLKLLTDEKEKARTLKLSERQQELSRKMKIEALQRMRFKTDYEIKKAKK